ncbi:hypothetical protein AGMMS49975_25520 [Clostridia bacterium]|nr:hypothetical protein AGMMS49975_25520 [Clostridia bacterium]
MILASIAMEEVGLSHILNAEGEKIQYALGTLPGCGGAAATLQEVIEVNNSVKCVLDSVKDSQMILKNKMESAIGCCSKGAAGCAPKRSGVALRGYANYCWRKGSPMRWVSSDCDALIFKQDIVVNFTLDLCSEECDAEYVSIGIQTSPSYKKTNHFVCNAQVARAGVPFTVAASGVYIPCESSGEMVLTLLSPDSINVRQSSIWVTEV